MPYTKQQRSEHYLKHRERFLHQSREQRARPGYKKQSANWEKRRRSKPERKAYLRAYRLVYYQGKRNEAIDAYGGKCVQCDETDRSALHFDHVMGDGKEHRKRLNSNHGLSLFRDLKKNNWPLIVQLLCRTCHTVKSKGER